jgi:hypothetical protein
MYFIHLIIKYSNEIALSIKVKKNIHIQNEMYMHEN